MNKEIKEMSIKTSVNALINHVRIHGIDTTDIETTNKISDILGNANIAEMVEDAKKDLNTFMFIVRYVWSIRDVINFYNEHFNPIMSEYQKLLEESASEYNELQNKLSIVHNRNSELDERNSELEKRSELMLNEIQNLKKENQILESKNENLENQITELKVKLFDLMNK